MVIRLIVKKRFQLGKGVEFNTWVAHGNGSSGLGNEAV